MQCATSDKLKYPQTLPVFFYHRSFPKPIGLRVDLSWSRSAQKQKSGIFRDAFIIIK